MVIVSVKECSADIGPSICIVLKMLEILMHESWLQLSAVLHITTESDISYYLLLVPEVPTIYISTFTINIIVVGWVKIELTRVVVSSPVAESIFNADSTSTTSASV